MGAYASKEGEKLYGAASAAYSTTGEGVGKAISGLRDVGGAVAERVGLRSCSLHYLLFRPAHMRSDLLSHFIERQLENAVALAGAKLVYLALQQVGGRALHRAVGARPLCLANTVA